LAVSAYFGVPAVRLALDTVSTDDAVNGGQKSQGLGD
jgi:hypothetical protein